MKIVALDGHTLNPGDNPWDPVAALGEFAVYDKTPDELVLERAEGAQVILTNKVPLTPAVFDALPELQFVSVTATGFNVVDTAAARARYPGIEYPGVWHRLGGAICDGAVVGAVPPRRPSR